MEYQITLEPKDRKILSCWLDNWVCWGAVLDNDISYQEVLELAKKMRLRDLEGLEKLAQGED